MCTQAWVAALGAGRAAPVPRCSPAAHTCGATLPAARACCWHHPRHPSLRNPARLLPPPLRSAGCTHRATGPSSARTVVTASGACECSIRHGSQCAVHGAAPPACDGWLASQPDETTTTCRLGSARPLWLLHLTMPRGRCFFAHEDAELRKPEEDPLWLQQQLQEDAASGPPALCGPEFLRKAWQSRAARQLVPCMHGCRSRGSVLQPGCPCSAALLTNHRSAGARPRSGGGHRSFGSRAEQRRRRGGHCSTGNGGAQGRG